jgi:hypothetical protein
VSLPAPSYSSFSVPVAALLSGCDPFLVLCLPSDGKFSLLRALRDRSPENPSAQVKDFGPRPNLRRAHRLRSRQCNAQLADPLKRHESEETKVVVTIVESRSISPATTLNASQLRKRCDST